MPSLSRPVFLALLWVLVLGFDAVALFGVGRLSTADGLEDVFRSQSLRHAEFVEAEREFPTADTLLIVLEAEDFAAPNFVSAAANFLLDLQLVDGVEAVLSPFAVPFPIEGELSYLISEVALSQDQMASRIDLAREVQPEISRLLSADRRTMVMLLVPSADGRAADVLAEVDDLAFYGLQPNGIGHSFLGHPAVQVATSDALQQDFLTLNIAGAALGVFVLCLALRSVPLAILTAMVSGTGMLWAMGFLGWIGAEINVISIALPVLVLVLCFSDALHLAFDQRACSLNGLAAPVSGTLRRIAPACILTSVTTAFAFLSLAWSDSTLISNLGLAGAFAVLVAVLGVLVAHALVYLTAAHVIGLSKLYAGRAGIPFRALNWSALLQFGVRHAKPVAVLAIATTVVSVGLHVSAPPRFNLYENLHQEHQIRQTLNRFEQEFGPASTLQFLADPAGGTPLDAAQRSGTAFAEVDSALTVRSLATVAEMARNAGMPFSDVMDDLPATIRARLVSPETGRISIVVPFEYQSSRNTREIVTELEAALSTNPDADSLGLSRATGFEVMASFVSEGMLLDLNRSLLIALAASGILVAVWMRDAALGLLVIVPNLIPVSIVGAWLYLSGTGLQFTSGIALTLAFGLAIDDSLHVLNRVRLGAPPGGALKTPDAILPAMTVVAPILVISSFVLVAGMSGTLFATLPTVAFFGKLSIVVFVLALVADLLVLPALLKHFSLWQHGRNA